MDDILAGGLTRWAREGAWGIFPLFLSLLVALGSFQPATAQTLTAVNGLSCAGARATTSCSSNDFTSTVTINSQAGSCVSGGYYTLSGQVSIQSNSPDRYDIGFFVGEEGNNPTATTTVAQGATCSVTTFPTSPYPWFQASPPANSCGDFTGNQSATPTVQNLRVYCQGNSLGQLSVPYTLVWSNQDNQAGCTGPSNVQVGTSPKCIGGTAYVSGVTVLPNITKTDSVSGTVIAGRATNLTYTVGFSNLSATTNTANFTDPLPLNFTLGSIGCTTSSGVSSCPSGCTTGTCNGTAISAITTGSGLAVTTPAGSNCTNGICTTPGTVTFTLNGTYNAPNSSTSFTNTASGGIASYANSASDTIYVMMPPKATKSFGAATIPSTTGTTTLTITLSNPNGAQIKGASFTDTYPTGLVNAATPNGSTTCAEGVVSATGGGNALSLSGGTIPANGSCTVTVTVTSTSAGSYSNPPSPVSINTTNTNPGTLAANAATLVVMGPPTATKSFGPSAISISGTSTLTITLTNPNSVPITGVAFTDTYPSNITNAAAPNVSNSCGGSYTASAGSGSLSLSNGTIPAAINGVNGSCTISVSVTGVQVGTKTNSLPAGAITASNTGSNTIAGSADISVISTREAWYTLDNTSNYWADSSGNSHNGTPSNIGSSDIVSTTLIPTSPAQGMCKGVNITTDTSAATIYALNTGVDVRSLGAAHGGTIAFWYKGKAAWNEGANNNYDRTLFDATGSASGEFWLVLQQGGSLKFSLDNATNVSQAVTSAVQSIAAGTWAHVAVTWDFVAGSMCVYVNGALSGSCTNSNSITTAPSYGTLYVGDGRGVAYGVNRGNSADGVIDEIYLYNGALTASQISALMNAGHTCSNVNHYELSLPTSSVSCVSTPVMVTACADASSPCTNRTTTLAGQIASLATSGGTLAATTVTFDANGLASTTLSYPAAIDGAQPSVTLSGESIPAVAPRQCCPDGANCVAANSCSTSFKTAGFIFSSAADGPAANIPSQVAGVSSGTYYLRSVTTNPTTKACQSALQGSQAVSFAYACNNPATCYSSNWMSVNGNVNGGTATTIPGNNNGSVSSYLPVNMTFDANGNAPFALNYSDVGQVTLYVKKLASGTLLSDLAGVSNAFVVRPYTLVLTDIQQTAAPNTVNPAAADATGSKFVKAGEAFSATVTAVNQTCSSGLAGYALLTDIPATCRAPGFGKEAVAKKVTLVNALAAGLGLANNPTLTNPSAFGTFSGGSATGTTFGWGEVGIITLTPRLAGSSGEDDDYLGAGDLGVVTPSRNVGRFYPDHFDTVVAWAAGVPMACPSALTCPALYNGMVYSGQPFTTNVYAKNGASGVTQNYTYSAIPGKNFAKAVTLSAVDSVGGTAISTSAPGGTLSATAVAASSFTNGSTAAGTPGMPVFTFAATPTVPTDVYVRATESAGDGVTSLRVAASVEGGVKVVSGRVMVPSAYGSELLKLPVKNVKVQYYNGPGWVTSSTDNTVLLTNNVATANCLKNLGNPSPACKPIVTVSSVALTNGVGLITLNAPGVGNYGSVDLTLNQGGWPAWLPSTTGRACFGSCGPRSPVIYLRERY